MKTKMTDLLEIEYPIMLAGMSLVAEPELVAAVSNAGGLGMLATGAYTPQQTREAIQKIRQSTKKPFGCNVSLVLPNSKENVIVSLEEKVPVINWSLGKADWVIKAVHAYGGKALGTVVMAKHALRAEKDGADALIVTGHEAAAHGGEVTSLVLIPSLARQVEIPLIAAGGFASGRGLAAALVLGAEGVSFGTRFALTKESPIHAHMKELCYKAQETETIYTDKFDGVYSRLLKTRAAESIAQGIGINPFKAFKSARMVKKMLDVPYWKMITSGLKQSSVIDLARLASGIACLRTAIETGDEGAGIMLAGQDIGLIDGEMTVKEVIESVISEAKQILKETYNKAIKKP
jgi:enoyl-[acyl-carrier protein] reductase II